MASNVWLVESLRCVVLFLLVAAVADLVYAKKGANNAKKGDTKEKMDEVEIEGGHVLGTSKLKMPSKRGEPNAERGDQDLRLFMRDPVEVGHIQRIKLKVPSDDGELKTRLMKLKTLATKPPLFEISNFLTDADCDHLIELGEQMGLNSSTTVTKTFDENFGVFQNDGVTPAYDVTQWQERFKEYDVNGDGKLDNEEAHKCVPGLKGTDRNLTLGQVQQMYHDLIMDADSNGYLDVKEFWVLHQRHDMDAKVKAWLDKLDSGELKAMMEVRRGRSRISDQAWVSWFRSKDQLLQDLPNRLAVLTGIDRHIIESSERIQVARYLPGGRYNGHYDSHDIDPEKICSHTQMILEEAPNNHPKGRMCRFITIMTYLSDVEEGGETAFPLADNQTYSVQEYDKQKPKLTDLTHYCHTANTFVKPKKGKTVMWYNHELDPESGWLGPKIGYSVHGGCDVIKGVKWIANHWITVDDIRSRQMDYHDKIFPPTKTLKTQPARKPKKIGKPRKPRKTEL